MCGIAGAIGFGDQETLECAERMARVLAHRGPDDEGAFAPRPGVALAQRRLAILDLTPRAAQPMTGTNGRFTLIYNGELYNFRELRGTLAADHGCRFESTSDTEVILNAFAVWGEAALTRFNGMFALALWDDTEGRLTLARDHAGIKPLYIWAEPSLASATDVPGSLVLPKADADGHDATKFAFASEAKALLALPEVQARINPEGLANYLAHGHASGDVTMLDGIYKLPPGWLLRWQDGRVRRQRWDAGTLAGTAGNEPFAPSEPLPTSYYDACRELRELLEKAVQRQVVADVPVGLFLSGGVDSSALAALAVEFLGRENTHTFSLGFQGAGEQNDETSQAKLVAEQLGTKHHTLTASEEDLIAVLDELVVHYDEPFADAAALPALLLTRLSREHVKVCLSGEGADELFGGYRRYVSEAQFTGHPLWRRLVAFSPLPELVGLFPRMQRLKPLLRACRQSDAAARYASYLTIFDAQDREELVLPQWRATSHDPVDTWRRRDPGPHLGRVGRLCLMDQRAWLVDTYLEQADKVSMSASLEVRVPYLDREVIAFANRLPDAWRIKRGSQKRILRDAMRSKLPKEILERPNQGFAVPLDAWLRGPLSQMLREELLGSEAASASYLDQAAVARLIEAHQRGRADLADQLWALLIFERWLRRLKQDPS